MSLKRIKAVSNVLKNGGNLSKAMRDAGYSKIYADNPQKMKRTLSFQQLLDKHLPDSKVVKIHGGLLNASHLDNIQFSLVFTDEEIKEMIKAAGCKLLKIKRTERSGYAWFMISDNRARDAALDKIYKLRGHYAAEKVVQVNPVKEMTDDELNEELKTIESEQKQRKQTTGSK